MKKASLKIALTGVMGGGKSTVAELFRKRGAKVIDADRISRGLLEPHQPGWLALKEEFADRFFRDDGGVDRKKLRSAIFSDRKLRNRVDSLLHPLIRKVIDEIYAGRGDQAPPPPITLVEVPLLYEVGWQGDFDIVIAVIAEKEVCLKRVMNRDEVDLPDAEAAFAAQFSPEEKAAKADYIIENSGDLDAVSRQVDELYEKLIH